MRRLLSMAWFLASLESRLPMIMRPDIEARLEILQTDWLVVSNLEIMCI